MHRSSSLSPSAIWCARDHPAVGRNSHKCTFAQGGNLFKITGANQSELHAYWDSGANMWPDDPPRPLSPDGTKVSDAYLFVTVYTTCRAVGQRLGIPA
jgi:hypothetical protein